MNNKITIVIPLRNDNYYNNLNDANISATDWSQGLDDTYNNPYYNNLNSHNNHL